MKRYGTTWNDYWRYYRGIDPANAPEAVNADEAAKQLYGRYYACTTSKLKKLVEQGCVDGSDKSYPQNASWTKKRIEQAAKEFEKSSDFHGEAQFLSQHGLTMTDYYAGIQAAFDSAVNEFGSLALSLFPTPIDPDYFRMILEPPVRGRKARIRFELQDEIRQELEAKRKPD